MAPIASVAVADFAMIWRRVARAALFPLLALALMTTAVQPAQALSEAEDLVERSRLSLLRLIDNPDIPELKTYLDRAHGVLIVPSLVKGGFIIGGEGGSGDATDTLKGLFD